MNFETWVPHTITTIFIILLWALNLTGVTMQNGIEREEILRVRLLIKVDLLRWENSGEDKGGFAKKLKDQLIYQLLMIYFQSMKETKIKLKLFIHKP